MIRNEFNQAFNELSKDERVTVWHVSLYMALFYRCHANGYKNPVSITRREIMKLAHIGSVATYHKCIKELQQFGFIEYLPSFDPSLGSQVNLYKRLGERSL